MWRWVAGGLAEPREALRGEGGRLVQAGLRASTFTPKKILKMVG